MGATGLHHIPYPAQAPRQNSVARASSLSRSSGRTFDNGSRFQQTSWNDGLPYRSKRTKLFVFHSSSSTGSGVVMLVVTVRYVTPPAAPAKIAPRLFRITPIIGVWNKSQTKFALTYSNISLTTGMQHTSRLTDEIRVRSYRNLLGAWNNSEIKDPRSTDRVH